MREVTFPVYPAFAIAVFSSSRPSLFSCSSHHMNISKIKTLSWTFTKPKRKVSRLVPEVCSQISMNGM